MKKRGHPIIHGGKGTRLYTTWRGIRARCLTISDKNYQNYGGRGITICNEWSDFSNFRNWALSNGYNDTLTIDRINNDGNYEPSNCRWVVKGEQSKNRRNTNGILCKKDNVYKHYHINKKLIICPICNSDLWVLSYKSNYRFRYECKNCGIEITTSKMW